MNSVLAVLSFIAARAREPSTWAGVAVLAGLFHISIPPNAADMATQAIGAITNIASNVSTLIALGGSIYAIVRPDRSSGQAAAVDALQQTVNSLVRRVK
jgi:hypothetical protein